MIYITRIQALYEIRAPWGRHLSRVHIGLTSERDLVLMSDTKYEDMPYMRYELRGGDTFYTRMCSLTTQNMFSYYRMRSLI